MNSNRLLLQISKRYPLLIICKVLLGLSGALFNGVSTALIAPVLLDFLGQPIDTRAFPPVIQNLFEPFEDIANPYRLMAMISAIVLAIVLKNVTGYLGSLVSGILSRRLTRDLREDGLDLLLNVDLDFFAKMRIGDLINRLNNEVNRAAGAVNTSLRMVESGLTILVFIGLLLAMSWQLTIASTLLLGFVAWINQQLIQRAKYFGQMLSSTSRDYSIRVLEALNGMRLIRAVGSEEREFKLLKQLIRDRETMSFKSQMNSSAVSPLSEVAGIIALLTIVAMGRLFFAEELEALSTVLLTYLFLLFRLLPIVSQLNGARNQFANTAASVEIVHDFLRRDNKPFMANGTRPYMGLKQGIRFNQLSFAYPDHNDLVLNDITLDLPKGTSLALVGSSGAGKSTLADLLPRFYDPTEGAIEIDGHDLRELDLKSFRREVGIVSQDTFLFNDTIRNNIAYARPDATDEEVFLAAKRANAHEFIQALPLGFETLIGDRGIMLSGGQRQRIAIARALLQNPEILILDEATSALDTVSERLVQQALDELSRDRTILVIAHRLSTIQNADQIAVLDRGKVVEVGTHAELLERGNYYARLHAMQFSDTTPQPEISADRQDMITRLSYDIRTHLTALLGVLQFQVDGLVSDSKEQMELNREAYQSAADLLKLVELVEHNRLSPMLMPPCVCDEHNPPADQPTDQPPNQDSNPKPEPRPTVHVTEQ